MTTERKQIIGPIAVDRTLPHGPAEPFGSEGGAGTSALKLKGRQVRGRGSRSNDSGRFEPLSRSRFEDEWPGAAPENGHNDESVGDEATQTRLIQDASRTILARNSSPDIPFDRSINPYRGCEHGCSYCYARPSHAYLGHSPGLDFESLIYFKPQARELLQKALRRPGYDPSPIALGSNTDPYQPAEARLRLTRQILETLAAFRHPVTIVTKSALIEEDAGLLGEMAADNLVHAALSITTLDRRLARAMEPRAATPSRRLEAVEALAKAGVPVRVMVAPVIPGLNDAEMDDILNAAARAGAQSANYVALRLPLEIKTLFREWLETAVPDRAARVISLIRQMRGGRDYDPAWRTRMTGTGPLAKTLRDRFHLAARRAGLDQEVPSLATDLFQVPAKQPVATAQLSLF